MEPMLTPEESNFVYQQAYLPEHVVEYVQGISEAEPHLYSNHLCFTKGDHLIFIGYPLRDDADTEPAYQSVCHKFNPAMVNIIAPKLWFHPRSCQDWQEDTYYRLHLPLQCVSPEVVYMVRRAEREVKVSLGKFGKEHWQLVTEFLAGHQVSREQRLIFERIPQYLARSKTARLLEARRESGILVAFSVMDLGSANYAFWLFNFRSIKENVPGASDLIFHKMVSLAQEEGKTAINLGLGVNPGIRRFKEKWGGVAFLPYFSCRLHRQPLPMEALLKKL